MLPDGLKKIALAAIADYHRLEAGLQVSEVRRKKYLLQDRRIKSASEKLETGRYDVAEFLRTVSNYYNVPESLNSELNDDDEELQLVPLDIGN